MPKARVSAARRRQASWPRHGHGGVDWTASLGCPRAIVGTKVDKLTRAERDRHARAFHSAFDVPVPLLSAHTGEGLDQLWKTIASLLNRPAA